MWRGETGGEKEERRRRGEGRRGEESEGGVGKESQPAELIQTKHAVNDEGGGTERNQLFPKSLKTEC